MLIVGVHRAKSLDAKFLVARTKRRLDNHDSELGSVLVLYKCAATLDDFWIVGI
jgi:hypothetical protein